MAERQDALDRWGAHVSKIEGLSVVPMTKFDQLPHEVAA
jgi:hypothetical protein